MARRVLQLSLALLTSTVLVCGLAAPATAATTPPAPDPTPLAEVTETPNSEVVEDVTPEPHVHEVAEEDTGLEETASEDNVVETPAPRSAPMATKAPAAKTPATKTVTSAPQFVLPMASKTYRVSSHWGYRCPSRVGAGIYHNATDMAADDGTPIYAVMAGTVTIIQEPVNATTAGSIVIDHGVVDGKKLITSYTHSWDPKKYVRVGQKVAQGQLIAEVGSSGVSSGPHLHFVAKLNGVDVDPLPYFLGYGLDIAAHATRVVAPLAPIVTCPVYTQATMGLKASALNTSPTIATVPDGTFIEVVPMVPISGYVKVTVAGKTGYIQANTLAPKPRASAPVLPSTGSTDKGFTYSMLGNSIQNFRDFPSLVLGESAILDSVTSADRFVATGRTVKNQGYDWQEFTFEGRTGWSLMNNGYTILAGDPQGTVKNAALTNKTKTVTATVLYTQPTTNAYAKSNVKISIKSGTSVVATGVTYGSWAQVKYSNKLYWTPTSSLKDPVVAKPKPNPTIVAGDVVARDSAGNLWNYGNLTQKAVARKLIGGGWKSAKSLNVTDFNADGVRDIVVNFSDGKLYVYLGKLTGGFEARKVIGSSGWQSLEVHTVKMKKTDKYPSIVTRTAAGALNLYSNNGSSIKFVKQIGNGWKGFAHINFGYFDTDGNVDVLAQNAAGSVLLYRTNGSAFVSETRKTIGTGWKTLRPVEGASHHGAKTTGLVAIRSDGRLLYYGLDGKSRFIAGKLVGNGWGSFTVARQSI